jgi:alanine racemase
MRRTRIELSGGALRHNLAELKAAVGGRLVWPMVKANAYGHGIEAVVRVLADTPVDGFGVATLEEGIALRERCAETARHGAAPILLFAAEYGDAHGEIARHGLTPVIQRVSDVEKFARASGGKPFAVHVEVDTGMSRLGLRFDALDALLATLGSAPSLRVEGVFTHLAASESPDEDRFTERQLWRFEAARKQLAAAGHRPMAHAANSGAILRHPESFYDAVRPGISFYGIAPSPGLEARTSAPSLKPALRLVGDVHSLRRLHPGDTVGYDRTSLAKAEMLVATVPFGYGDGLHRAASNRGAALVRGVEVPFVGRISMDSVMLDVTGVPGVGERDEVVFIGAQGKRNLSVHDLARASGTNAYEVTTSLSARLPRVAVD